LQRLGLGRSSSKKDGEGGETGGSGGGIFLPPPKSWKSKMQTGQNASSSSSEQRQEKEQQQQHAAEAPVKDTGSISNSSNSSTDATAEPSTGQVDVAAPHTVPSSSEPPAGFVCPITNDVMKDPVRACDGLAYEREAIEVGGCSSLAAASLHTSHKACSTV
jgi:hypothetical protein